VGKIFSAGIQVIVTGDSDFVSFSGDSPEVIGEASILMAQTCFPDEGLDGGKGHSQLDVLCKSLSHSTILTTPNVSKFPLI
jgi:hypothetical protein